MLIVGIDPGKNGAVVGLQGKEVYIELMKDAVWFADHMESLRQRTSDGLVKVYLERAQPMPKNGAVSMFNYGQHYGELIGVLTALCISFETVPPSVWTKALHQTRKSALTPKARSLQAVQRLFPDVRLTAPDSERATKPHDGIVDALLIAEYGRRQWTKS
jgi:hypothetical protein